MSRLYGRRLQLVASSSKDGRGLDLSDLHCTFQVRAWEMSTPGAADVRIYNIAAPTAARIGARELDRLTINAGYEGQYGTIFDGAISQTRAGRENGTDTYLDITAWDGNPAHTFAVVNATLAQPRPGDVRDALLASLAAHGAEPGYCPPLPGAALPRGRALYGLAREHMHDLADAHDMTWTIQGGRVTMVERLGHLPGEAVVLTAETGLVGIPEQTQDGIMVRCLLNPTLQAGRLIDLQTSPVRQQRLPLGFAGADPRAQSFLPAVSRDGVYRILAVDHSGDTRGEAWHSEAACMDPQGFLPPAQVQRGRGTADERAAALAAQAPPPGPADAPAGPPRGPGGLLGHI